MIISNKGYDFDDLLLIPRISTVNSRTSVDTSIKLSKSLKLDIPIIASPMKGITGVNLITKLNELGGIGILHRFYESKSKWKQDINTLITSESRFGVAVGLDSYEEVEYAVNVGADIICVDVANGYLESVGVFCKAIEESIHNDGLLLMAGNVATSDGYKILEDCGVDLIRTGIGPGALCTTRNVTGVGVPQLSAIDMCFDISNRSRLVADGGIKNSGDMVKALAAGADVVMIGSLFAKAFESEHNGIIYGMASKRLQDEYYHNTKSIEGLEAETVQTDSLKDIVDGLIWGLKSACTYLNSSNLYELRMNAEFITVGNGSIKKL